MKPSITELVSVILAKIRENPREPQSESGLRSWLKRQGYNKRDIDAAIKLVRPRFGPRPHVSEYRPGAVRSLSLLEEHKLTSEARDALARLEMYELIDPFEREMILDRMHQFEGPVGLQELDYLLSWIVCGGRDVEFQQAISQVLDGQGGMLS